ncbi:MAG: hypothetical protein F6J95_031370 [Leptolyngbya sp. SIO1E4]|nr:hypothetical protein [Leptolyngbya sp. SIO1E4]
MKGIAEAGRLVKADSGVFGLAIGAAHDREGGATVPQCIAQLTGRDTPKSSVLTLSNDFVLRIFHELPSTLFALMILFTGVNFAVFDDIRGTAVGARG